MTFFPGACARANADGGKGRKSRRSVRLLLAALGLAGMSMVLLVTDLAESLVSLHVATITAHRIRMLAAAGLRADLDVERPGLDQLEVTYKNDGSFSAVNATIAIATCASSRKIPPNRPIYQMPLVELMAPSLLRTAETDRFRYKLFVGIDDDDAYWMDEGHQRYVKNMFENANAHHSDNSEAEEGEGESTNRYRNQQIEVVFLPIPQRKDGGRHRVPFNEVCRAAYDDGADYVVRINDDTEFTSEYWTSVGIAALLTFHPPNLGVVGPTCGQGNTRILTHDMTHRTHMEVFGRDQYYPPVFGNLFLDDWISAVYGPSRTAKLPHWHVHHHAALTRYQYRLGDETFLAETLAEGRQSVDRWLESISI